MDVFMPGLDGPQTASKIRAISPTTKILLTSVFALQTHPRYLGRDFDAFVRKDDLMSEFSSLVGEWFGGSRGPAGGCMT